MVCLWCGKKIGAFRGVFDQQFCSSHHRKLARKAPDRVLQSQDVTADYGTRELWAVDKQQKKKSYAAGWAAFAMLGLGALTILGMLGARGNGGGKGSAAVTILSSLSPTFNYSNVPSTPWWQRASVTMRHDFSQGAGEWVNAGIRRGRDWSLSPSGVRPGSLKIWERSAALADYDLEFQARIEQRGLSWAFRAADLKNFYATKLLIQNPQSAHPNAGLVRYAMLNGQEFGREQFPIPLALERGKPYRIRLSVQGSKFVTTVNGQVVGYWNDSRLSRGGFGFFADSGEVSTIQWMALSERDSTLGRLLSYFSLIRAPWIIAPVPVSE